MTRQLDHGTRPGLLVSVRDATEALAALAGGANVIDVKEPSRGSLGAADAATIAAVVRAVDGRAIVTAAMGELMQLAPHGMQLKTHPVPLGVSVVKVGLAGCRNQANWPARWRAAVAGITRGESLTAARPVAVVYADWRTAAAPPPDDVLDLAIDCCCPAVLVDTFTKSRGALFDHWPVHELAHFVTEVRSHRIAVVLAGSLRGKAIGTAARLRPDFVAVRAAACKGGRSGAVDPKLVKDLLKTISAAILPRICRPATEK